MQKVAIKVLGESPNIARYKTMELSFAPLFPNLKKAQKQYNSSSREENRSA
jgi:hypothetical protein